MVEQFTIRAYMDAMRLYIPFIKENGINSDVIRQIIIDHDPVRNEVIAEQKRHEVTDDGVPILNRTSDIGYKTGNDQLQRLETLVNNKVNTAFGEDIIGTKIGYTLGIPINYVVEKVREEKRLQKLVDEIDRFRVRENIPDKDTSWGTRTSVSGYGARLCYISLENNKPIVRVANVNPAECVFLYEDSMSEPTFALQYYTKIRINADNQKEMVNYVEFHDDLTTQYFEESNGEYILVEERLHGFNYCPLFGMENDDSLNGELKKVRNLIDAYDRVVSDANNEIEAMRLAYLILQNAPMDEEDLEKLGKTGVFQLFGPEANVSFLTKDVNDTIIQNQLKILERNIYRITRSVNFTDESFAGNLSGIAIKFKTLGLEQKAIVMEHKMRSALQYQFKVMCSAWAKLGICEPDDYLNVWFGFKRNLPVNLLEEAQATALYKGNISEDTRLSMLSSVDDVAGEREAMKQDQIEFGESLPPLVPIGLETKQQSANNSDLDNENMESGE